MNALRRWLIRILAGRMPVVLNARIAAATAVPAGTLLRIWCDDDHGLIEGSSFQACGVLPAYEPLPRLGGSKPMDVEAPSMKLPWDSEIQQARLRRADKLVAQRATAIELAKVTPLSVEQAEVLVAAVHGDPALAKAAAQLAATSNDLPGALMAFATGRLDTQRGGQH